MQNDYAKASIGKVLLIAQTLIGGYDRCKALGLGDSQELPVLQILPAALESGDDLVVRP